MRISVPATSANLGPGFDTLGIAIKLKNQVIIKPSKFPLDVFFLATLVIGVCVVFFFLSVVWVVVEDVSP